MAYSHTSPVGGSFPQSRRYVSCEERGSGPPVPATHSRPLSLSPRRRCRTHRDLAPQRAEAVPPIPRPRPPFLATFLLGQLHWPDSRAPPHERLWGRLP